MAVVWQELKFTLCYSLLREPEKVNFLYTLRYYNLQYEDITQIYVIGLWQELIELIYLKYLQQCLTESKH